jgi:chromosome segregation ATPase
VELHEGGGDTADAIDEFRLQRNEARHEVRELQDVVDNITAENAEAAWEWKQKVYDRDTIINSMKDGHATSELQSECERHKEDLAKRDEEVLKYRAMRPLLQARITETLEAHAKAAEGWKKEVGDRDKKIESMKKHMEKILQEQVDVSDMQMQAADSALEDADEDADEV